MNQRDDWHLTEIIGHETGRGDPFAAAMRATRMPMVISDPRRDDNPIIFANEAFQKLTGYARDEIVGRNCRFLQGPDSDRDAVGRLRAAIEAGEAITVDLKNYRKDGTWFWNALFVSPVRGEDGSVHYYVASQMDVTERVEWQSRANAQRDAMEREVRARTADLEEALEAKTTLLHEVDHRVKNNLMMIGSLLRLQSRSLPDPRLRATLEQMLQRVDALASVHRRLYQAHDIERFDIGSFATSLANDLIGASGRRDIALQSDVATVEIPARKAAPVGLILNEVITNAIKHAYPDGAGEMKLSVRRQNGTAQIDVRDDGPGFDVSMKPRDSIGRVLVDRLSRSADIMSDTPTLKVLIVEDEALLAMDIESMVEDAGHDVVGEAASVREVTALPMGLHPTLALVDIQLDEGSSGLDASRIIRERWPAAAVVFVTANPTKVPQDFAGAYGVISKPFSRNGLVTAIRYLEEAIFTPPPVSHEPGSFTIAPSLASSWGRV
eukprot:gene8903-8992_t